MRRDRARSGATASAKSVIPALAVLLAWPAAAAAQSGQAPTEPNDAWQWSVIGGDLAHTRYAPYDQINPSNFENLEVEWVWDGASFGTLTARATPIYVDGVLYSTAGERRHVVALDAETGALLWSFREPDTFRWEYSMRKNHGKGVFYAEVDGRGVIYYVSPAFFLHAIDAKTGRHLEDFGGSVPIDGFPETGVVDVLRDLVEGWGPWEDAGRPWDPARGIPLELGYVTNSPPPMVLDGVVIVPTTHEQGYNQSRNENIPGDILAYDTRTGEKLWKFHIIPRPGEYGHETWLNDAWRTTGDISQWAPMTADPELGLVYIPTNGPTNDWYSGFRPGENLYGNVVLALDVRTGERVWHYQTVRNDLWNYDNPTAPILLDLTVDGERVPAVVQATKQAFLYTFNRETGEPVWPFEDRPVPESDVPGEWTSPTQPFPTRPAPYDLQGLSEDDLIDFTPELRQEALEILEDFRIGPLFNPPLHIDNDAGKRAAVWCPGSVGGTNITGPPVADPASGILYVTSVKGCTSHLLVPGEDRDAVEEMPAGRTIARYASGGSSGFSGPQGLPIYKPPYGRITAVDMNTGEHLWWIPVGETPEHIENHPALEGVDLPQTGTGAHAAMMTTPSMLLYTAAASDGTPLLHAVDKATGEELGRVEVPGLGRYGMMAYVHEGRQRIVLQVSGALVALSLP